MRHFFIKSLDFLIGLFVVIGFLGVGLAALAASTGGLAGVGGPPVGGAGAALFLLIAGTLYIAFVAGFLYLGVGIYHNTKRTADAVEALLGKERSASRDTFGGRKEPTI